MLKRNLVVQNFASTHVSSSLHQKSQIWPEFRTDMVFFVLWIGTTKTTFIGDDSCRDPMLAHLLLIVYTLKTFSLSKSQKKVSQWPTKSKEG